MLGVTALGPADRESFFASAGVRLPVLADADGAERERHAVSRCPAVRVVSGSGEILYRWDAGSTSPIASLEIERLGRALEQSDG